MDLKQFATTEQQPFKLSSLLTIWLCLFTCLLANSVWTNNAWANNNLNINNTVNKETINYCIDPSWQPYEGLEQQKHIGISSDYLNYFASNSGFTLQLIKTNSWLETLQLLKSGHCHLTPMLNKSEERSKYLSFSDIYFTAPNVLVSLRNQPFLQDLAHVENRSVAIVKGYRLIEYIKQYFPTIQLSFVSDEQQGLDYVAKGKVKLFIGSMLSVNSNIVKEGLSELKIAGWAGPEDRLRLAVIKSKKHLLPSINQAIANITESKRLEIYRKWHNIKVIDKINYKLWWQSIGIVSVLFFSLLLRNRTINRYNLKLKAKNTALNKLTMQLEQVNKKLKFTANHDPLTQLYNRQYFNEKLANNHREHKEGVTLIIIDIDNFKDINDQYGHCAGDQILMILSKILRQQLREEDLLARWGGEEFVIISTQSNVNSAKQLSSRIQAAINQHTFPYCKKLSCSFGVAEHHNKESISTCFERADKALYQAKDQGRNQVCCADSE